MMGHINNLVVQLVRENLGEDGVKRLFEELKKEPVRFQTEVIYSEDEFQKLFAAAQTVFGVDSDTAEKVFAKYFVDMSPKLYPAIFRNAKSARELFEKVPLIHRNFPAAASRGTYKDKLFILESKPEHMILEYDSPNQLCVTLQTVAGHILAYYGEVGEVRESACKKEGAPRCRIQIDFRGKAAA